MAVGQKRNEKLINDVIHADNDSAELLMDSLPHVANLLSERINGDAVAADMARRIIHAASSGGDKRTSPRSTACRSSASRRARDFRLAADIVRPVLPAAMSQ